MKHNKIQALVASAKRTASRVGAASPLARLIVAEVFWCIEEESKRLAKGVPFTADLVDADVSVDHGTLPQCGTYAYCKKVESCKTCDYYELFYEKLKDNFGK